MAELLMQLKNALCDFLGGACEYHLAAPEVRRPAGGACPGRPISAEPVWNMRISCSR
jgi:hypothetical protein